MESEITLDPLNRQKDKTDTDEPSDDGSLIAPDRGKTTRKQKGDTVTDGKGSKEPARLSVGKVEMILQQWKDRGEEGPCGKVEKPEAPEDEKGKKFHLGAFLLSSCGANGLT